MEEEEVLKLIDSYWFSREIFKKSSKKIEINSSSSSSTSSEESPAADKEKEFENSSLSKSEVSISSQSTLMETKKGLNKSLSELEFEEVKGFMDLGFVFSEEDKDSSLVEIIPGLQRRLGKEIRQEEEEEEEAEEQKKKKFIRVSRPYLSEAWEVLEMRKSTKKKKNPLMNWRVPNTSNEIDMKDSLKWWAHTVASTVIQ